MNTRSTLKTEVVGKFCRLLKWLYSFICGNFSWQVFLYFSIYCSLCNVFPVSLPELKEVCALVLYGLSSWLLFKPWATCSQNQFFISGLSGDEIIRNRVLEALYRRILRAYNEKKCFRVIIVIPLLPGFQVLILAW